MKKTIHLFIFSFTLASFSLFSIQAKKHEEPNPFETKESTNNCCFDLIIIGGGSAAFSAAIEANKLGKKTLMINAGLRLGGTCLNVGCMPSKYLVRLAERIYLSSKPTYHGVEARHPIVSFHDVIKGKKDYVKEIWDEKYPALVRSLNNVKIIKGWAKFKDKNIIVVNNREYKGDKIIIATGANTNIPNIKGLRQIEYLTHRTLFDLEHNPHSITIIGAGYIGLEIATIYSQLGVKVKVIEKADRILPNQTKDISDELEKHLTDLGIEFYHNFKAEKIETHGIKYVIHGIGRAGKPIEIVEKGRIVVATGVKANTYNLGVEEIKLKLDEKGQIIVNNRMETSVPNIYAAGDCINAPKYVYTAIEEGKIAVNNAFKKKKMTINYKYLPWVMFTNPQFAGAGIDEETARKLRIPYQVSTIPLSFIPKNSTSRDKRGFIKLIRNPKTDKLLGGRIIAPDAGELAVQLTLMIKYDIKVSDILSTFYPYLTLSEGIKIAAHNFK